MLLWIFFSQISKFCNEAECAEIVQVLCEGSLQLFAKKLAM